MQSSEVSSYLQGSSMESTWYYGDNQDQFYRLYLPSTDELKKEDGRMPLVVIIHGGFWKQKYDIDHAFIDSLPPFLQRIGFAVANLEYRRGRKEIDGGNGGWPNTNEDIISAFQNIYNNAEITKVINTISIPIVCIFIEMNIYLYVDRYIKSCGIRSFCRYFQYQFT
jgi:acetyl esterase/lipase